MGSNLKISMKGGKTQMDKSVSIALIVVIGVLALAGISYAVFSSMNPSMSKTITGNGQASIDVAPDLVKVYFNAETSGATSQEAKDKNSEIVDNMITALVKDGFERKDIQTQGFNIYPDYSWDNGKQTLKGYKATHSIVVQLSTAQTDKIGKVIDDGVDAGALISYINFELSTEKQNEYKAQAIKLAAEDARIKAQALADGLGKELGSLVSVSDNNFDYRPWPMYAAADSGGASVAMAKEAATNIQPGTEQVTASVTAVFKIK